MLVGAHLAMACMAVVCLTERNAKEASKAGKADKTAEVSEASTRAQKYEVVRRKLSALQEKSDRIISKLEAEAHTVNLGASVEIAQARDALVVEIEEHMKALQAELQFLHSPEFPYSHFKDYGKHVLERSNSIGRDLDRMAAILPDMKEKSRRYIEQSHHLLQGVDHLENKLIPEFRAAVSKEKGKEIHDINQIDLTEAFSHHDRQVLADASDDDWRLIKHGQFKHTAAANFGANPYQSMSKDGAWENSDQEGAEAVGGSEAAKAKQIAASAEAAAAEGSSLVEVRPRSLKLLKNDSRMQQYLKLLETMLHAAP